MGVRSGAQGKEAGVSEITVRALDEGVYGVELRDGETTSNHRVRVPPKMIDGLGLDDVDPEVVVRESMSFLLEREPPSSILPEFSLTDIPRYFADYYDELGARLHR